MGLSFYDHHRQGYGHMPIQDKRAAAEFMVGGYGDGLGEGGEFAIHLISLQNGRGGHELVPCFRVFNDAGGSLREFMDCGAWDLVAEAKAFATRDDFTALLVKAGLRDRSDFPVGHEPVCCCCGQKAPVLA